MYRTYVYAFALVIGAWQTSADPYSPKIEELLPELPPAQFAPTFGHSIRPALTLKDLRLAWTDRGTSFVELTYSAQTEGAFVKEFPEVMNEPESNVTAARERWILTHVPEEIGDKRWLYCADDGVILSARITGVGYEYDGLDGAVKFFGALEIPGEQGSRHLYISFPSKSHPSLEKRDKAELPRADIEATRNWMKSESDEPSLLMVTPKWFNPDINYKDRKSVV